MLLGTKNGCREEWGGAEVTNVFREGLLCSRRRDGLDTCIGQGHDRRRDKACKPRSTEFTSNQPLERHLCNSHERITPAKHINFGQSLFPPPLPENPPKSPKWGPQIRHAGPRQETEICDFGAPSPLDSFKFLLWFFL